MDILLPQHKAREILLNYEGFNNQLLEWKSRLYDSKNFHLTKTQSDYVLKYYQITPKVARKYVKLVEAFGKKLMEDKSFINPVEKIWVEKILCESDKAFHIYGRYFDNEPLQYFWIPKMSIIREEKKLNRVIDYSKYSERPPMEHQKIAIEKLLVNNRFILADDMGLGKGLTINTLIYTPTGKIKIGHLNVGDKVIGSDGKSHNVTGVFPQGLKQTYKITFNDGFSIECDEDHLWLVYSSTNSYNSTNERKIKPLVLSTKQLIDETNEIEIFGIGHNKDKKYKLKTYYKVHNQDNKWLIPIIKPIEFEYNDSELPLDPYFLGLVLGDGHIKNKSIVFTGSEDDFIELYTPYGIIPKKYKNKTVLNGTINVDDKLIQLKLNNTRSHTKFIPEMYKYSSIDNRLSILQGLMDTDGHCIVSKKNNNFQGTEYTTISKQLADDVCEIVQTLGGIARISSRRSFYKKNGIRIECKISYRVNIKLPDNMCPFRLKRKVNNYNPPTKYKVARYISNVEKLNQQETVCISVDSPDKLYVAEHCIVTHNTTSATIASIESNSKKILIICPASLKINWKREIETYSDKRITIIDGKVWPKEEYDYYIINYDILKNFHGDENIILNNKFDLAIVDESHFLSNETANRTQIANEILNKIQKVWLLTGTPMTSRPINMFNLLKIVQSPLALNWQHYVKRYCKGYQFKVKNKRVWKVDGASNLEELRERIKDIFLRRLKNDILDLPAKTISPIYLELKNKVFDDEFESLKKKIKNNEYEIIEIEDEDKENTTLSLDIKELMKLRQLIALEKIPYTIELIDKYLESDVKIIVLTNFTIVIDYLKEKYKKNSVVLDGRMNKKQKQLSVDRFQNDDSIKLFFGNIKAAGVGITLTAGEVLIMNDLSFVPGDHAQGEDRCYRIGQDKKTTIYYPIFENTFEKIIYNMIQQKKNNIETVMGDNFTYEDFIKDLLK